MSARPDPAPEIRVFRSEDLPLGASGERPFQAEELLRRFLPPQERISFAWVDLQQGHSMPEHPHERHRLLIVHGGSAELTGEMKRKVAADEVVAIPRGCAVGIDGVGGGGFRAVSIDFDEASGSSDAYDSTADGLLKHNQRRIDRWLVGPFYPMITDGTLDDSSRRNTFLDCIGLISDTFQTIMFGRQATCRDEAYSPVFLAHFREEFGHNELLAAREEKQTMKDPILVATASWFAHQMYIADNVDKTVLVHLVLEASGHHFHTLARERLSDDVNEEYHEVHAENDDHHTDMGVALLGGHQPETYRRLHRVLDEAWDMFETMTGRIAHIVKTQA